MSNSRRKNKESSGKEARKQMAVIYATLIIRGARTFAQVPATLKDPVRLVLIDLEMGYLAE